MLNTSDYLIYLENERLLICGSCRYCLQSEGVERHLRRAHKSIPLAVRKELVNFAKGLLLRSVGDIIVPNTPILALEYLEVMNSFMYLKCEALYGTEVSII